MTVMDAKMISAMSEVMVFNALADLADALDRGQIKDTADTVRARALERLEAAAQKLAE